MQQVVAEEGRIKRGESGGGVKKRGSQSKGRVRVGRSRQG